MCLYVKVNRLFLPHSILADKGHGMISVPLDYDGGYVSRGRAHAPYEYARTICPYSAPHSNAIRALHFEPYASIEFVATVSIVWDEIKMHAQSDTKNIFDCIGFQLRRFTSSMSPSETNCSPTRRLHLSSSDLAAFEDRKSIPLEWL